jgi:hypothetical protein
VRRYLSLDVNLAATTDDTIIIAGHGKAVGTKAELKEFRDTLVTIRDRLLRSRRAARATRPSPPSRPRRSMRSSAISSSSPLHEVGLRRRSRWVRSASKYSNGVKIHACVESLVSFDL